MRENEILKNEDLSENHLIQKSRPLFELWKTGFDLSEFKLLDVYLSKINSREPDNRTVTFNKNELNGVYGVKRIKTEDVRNSLLRLHEKAIQLYDRNEAKYKIVNLFEETDIYLNDEGISEVTMTCTQSAVKYFFNVEKLGYFKYKLGIITRISSVYAYLMFTYLEFSSNRKTTTWKVSVDELRAYLNCSNIESYKLFKEFNDKVLKKVHKELNDKHVCRYDYETIKTGRTVTEIKFTYYKDGELNVLPADDRIEYIETDDIITKLESISNSEFSRDDLQEIYNAIKANPKILVIAGKTEDDKICNYFKGIYIKLKGQKVNNPKNYLLKIIDNEIKDIAKEKAGEPHNKKRSWTSEEQSYDISRFDELAITHSSNTPKRT